MKYQKLIYAFMMAAAFTACSQDVSEAVGLTPEEAAGGLHMEDESDVKIQLASGSNATRTSGVIDNAKNSNDEVTNYFEATELGVFMLATNLTGVNPKAPVIDTWENANGEYKGTKFVWLDNIEANATIERNGSDEPIGTNINWNDGKSKYYPFNNWYGYKFFAYHPFRSAITSNGDSRIVSYTGLDGTTDILWGESKESVENDNDDPNSLLRYCAKYLRENPDNLPEIKFHHMLMQFQFYIYGLEDVKGTEVYVEAKKMSISKIEVLSVPSKAELVVAKRNPTFASYDERISFDWTNDLTDILVQPVKNELEFEKHIDQVNPQNDVLVGTPVLLPVPLTDETYKINIELKYNNGSEVETLTSEPIDINFFNYEPGKKYKIRVGVGGPQRLNIKATLDNWTDVNIDNMELN